jgi:formiminoglutamase
MKIDFAHIDSVRLSTFLRPRDGEEKIGERIRFAAGSIEESLDNFLGKYVLLGVEEDIGPRANLGQAGAFYAFKSFLGSFLNMQVNPFLDIENVMILGRVKAETLETGFAKRRQNVQELDDFMVDILKKVFDSNKIPIVVGGGHNNAYPLMKAYFHSKGRPIQVINLDAHADFRLLEGRHSGNSFSYAIHEGYLGHYTVLGLHKPYISEGMLREMKKYNLHHTYFEDYLDGKASLKEDTQSFINRISGSEFGVELDLDSIAMMPASAYTASGWSVNEARSWLRMVSKSTDAAYFNLTEGACELGTLSDSILGKTLAYFVYDLLNKA